MNLLSSALLLVAISFYSLRKRSLTIDGIVAANLVGLLTFTNQQIFTTLVLLTFFLTSSRLTKYKADLKSRLESESTEIHSGRDYKQVFCNGLLPSIFALCSTFLFDINNVEEICLKTNSWYTFFMYAFIGSYSCCIADTWASELGILNTDWPYLITNLKQVPPGTNGGISPLGCLVSLLGGQLLGVVVALSLKVQFPLCGNRFIFVAICACSGLMGSLIDSLIGATLQVTYYSEKNHKIIKDINHNEVDPEFAKRIAGRDYLDNNQVNLLSSLITALITGYVGNKYLTI